jgi:hypothetical protein
MEPDLKLGDIVETDEDIFIVIETAVVGATRVFRLERIDPALRRLASALGITTRNTDGLVGL